MEKLLFPSLLHPELKKWIFLVSLQLIGKIKAGPLSIFHIPLVIDEIFLLGLTALAALNTIFKKHRNSDQDFGGVAMLLLVGDPLQLRCVSDTVLYAPGDAPQAQLAEAGEIYKKCQVVFLEGNIRASRDQEYADLLTRFR